MWWKLLIICYLFFVILAAITSFFRDKDLKEDFEYDARTLLETRLFLTFTPIINMWYIIEYTLIDVTRKEDSDSE